MSNSYMCVLNKILLTFALALLTSGIEDEDLALSAPTRQVSLPSGPLFIVRIASLDYSLFL